MKNILYPEAPVLRMWLEGKGKSWIAQSLRVVALWDTWMMSKGITQPPNYEHLPATPIETIRDFHAYLLSLDSSEIYKRLIYSRIKSLADCCIRSGIYPLTNNNWRSPAIPRIRSMDKRPKRLMRPLTIEEAVRMKEAARRRGSEMYALFALLFGVGIRASEAVTITRQSLVYYGESAKLLVRQHKTMNTREVEIADWVRDALEWRLSELDGKDCPIVPWSRVRIWRAVKVLCGACGIDPRWVGSHSGRVTTISLLLALGTSYEDVQFFTGHKSVEMVRLYDRRIRGARVGKKINYEILKTGG